jgi:hypothetical protein
MNITNTGDVTIALKAILSVMPSIGRAERIDAVLETAALLGGEVHYAALGRILGVFSGSRDFRGVLDAKMHRDHDAGGPLWCSLVVSSEDHRPSQGFWDSAAKLGYTWSDPEQFWREQRDACYAAMAAK